MKEKEIVSIAHLPLRSGREAEVIMQKVVVTGDWGSNEITVYLPGKHVADSAVLVSHSTIHANSGKSAEMRASRKPSRFSPGLVLMFTCMTTRTFR
jgi:hypothetical protein